jgi:hypothetical protein
MGGWEGQLFKNKLQTAIPPRLNPYCLIPAFLHTLLPDYPAGSMRRASCLPDLCQKLQEHDFI